VSDVVHLEFGLEGSGDDASSDQPASNSQRTTTEAYVEKTCRQTERGAARQQERQPAKLRQTVWNVNPNISVQDRDLPYVAPVAIRKDCNFERFFVAILRSFQSHVPKRESQAGNQQHRSNACHYDW